MSTITTKDGTQLYYNDWGTGQPIVFSHGWPLSSEAFEDQTFYLASHGFRCIAHDRRGHGRSSQPWTGNDLDTYADDLAALVEALDLKDAVHVGHHGRRRSRAVHRPPRHASRGEGRPRRHPPLMLKTAATPTACRSRSSTTTRSPGRRRPLQF
jgi:non-heme chloroperoxidase